MVRSSPCVDHDQAWGAGTTGFAGSSPPWGWCVACSHPTSNWQEILGAGGPDRVRKSKATWLMGVHYAGQRVLHSAAVKRALIQRFLHLLCRKLPELALNAQGLVARDAWTWPEVAQMNESFGLLEAALIEAASPVQPSAHRRSCRRKSRMKRWTTVHRPPKVATVRRFPFRLLPPPRHRIARLWAAI